MSFAGRISGAPFPGSDDKFWSVLVVVGDAASHHPRPACPLEIPHADWDNSMCFDYDLSKRLGQSAVKQ